MRIKREEKITDAILLKNCKFVTVKSHLNDISRPDETRNSF